jgi:NAD(P)-dependent dehydrogenase (short-subunit alcohol dehydrogenase family)
MPTVLITGASRGLGLELARQYATDGWEVLACARNPGGAPRLATLAAQPGGHIRVLTLDVTDFGAIDSLARELDGCALDVLINCAGAMGRRATFGASDFAEWEQMFRINAFAPMKMAEAFVAHLARGSQKKLISISSVMASIAGNSMGGYYAYRASKAALNAITSSLAIDLGRRHGIIAAVIHPGWVRTDMGGPRAELDPATSVAGLKRVIAGLTAEQAGRFWSYDGKELPW